MIDIFGYNRFVFKDNPSEAPVPSGVERVEEKSGTEVIDESVTEASKEDFEESRQNAHHGMDVEGEGDEEMAIKSEYGLMLDEYTLFPVQLEIESALFETLDSNQMIRQSISGSIDLFDEKLNLGGVALTDSKGTVSVDRFSATLKMSENLSFWTERYMDGGSMYHGMSLQPGDNSSVDVGYSHEDKIFYLAVGYKNLSASMEISDEASVSGVYLEYDSDGVALALSVNPTDNSAQLNASFTF